MLSSRDPRWKVAALDLSTPEKTADYLQQELIRLFPKQHVKVEGQRGVMIEVAHMDEESYARYSLQNHYSAPPNMMVKVLLVPTMGSNAWTNLNIKPSLDNPELKNAGVQPIRKAGNLTPEKAVDAVLKWFKKNQAALTGA